MKHYLNAMRKYTTFTGRASRVEFWLFTLIAFLMMVVAAIIDGVIGFDRDALVLAGVLSLAHLIPSLSVSVRRLHDINKSGWWILLVFVPGIGAVILLVFACLESTRGPNRFGPATDGSSGATQAAAAGDPLDQLNKLKALHDSGTIDKIEFAKMKAELLSKVS